MRTYPLIAALLAAVPAFASAGDLGEHPAIIARRVIAAQGYDYASKFYPHPAWLYLRTEAPRQSMQDPTVAGSEPRREHEARASNAAAPQPTPATRVAR